MPRRCWWFLLPGLVAVSWPFLLLRRLYDPDEFEHLHAAWCVANGLVPYRDFFEHHGPLTYYLLAPFVGLFGDTPSLLTVHRVISAVWVVVAIAGVLVFLRKRTLSSSGVALTWLLTFPWFLEKAVEGRPDVAAMALVTWVAFLTRRAAASDRATGGIAAGLVAGIASLFTQKVIFVVVGMALGASIARVVAGKRMLPSLILAVVGFFLPWAAASIYFWNIGALESFLDRTLVTPATWPPHAKNFDESMLFRLSYPMSWAPGHLGVLAIILALGLSRLFRGVDWRNGRAIIWCGVVVHLLGAAFAPAYLQYYLLVAPLAAILVGEFTLPMLRLHGRRLASMMALWYFAATGLRFQDFRAINANPYVILDIVVSVAVIVSAVGLLWARFGRNSAWQSRLATTLLVVSLAPGIGRYAIYHFFWNAAEEQRQELTAFGELPPGPALDGFSGLGCLRPHVGYWWWINHHSLPLMRKEGAVQGVLELVRSRTPSVVVFDEDLRKMGAGLDGLLVLHYDQVPFGRRLVFVRRGEPSR